MERPAGTWIPDTKPNSSLEPPNGLSVGSRTKGPIRAQQLERCPISVKTKNPKPDKVFVAIQNFRNKLKSSGN